VTEQRHGGGGDRVPGVVWLALVWKDERKPQPIALSSGARKPTLCEEPFEKDDAEGLARLHALEAALRPIQT